MSDYTPGTKEVREQYIHQASVHGLVPRECVEGWFDRWLAKRDLEIKAEAWDEGHRVGWKHCQDGNYGNDYWDDDTPSPYGAQ